MKNESSVDSRAATSSSEDSLVKGEGTSLADSELSAASKVLHATEKVDSDDEFAEWSENQERTVDSRHRGLGPSGSRESDETGGAQDWWSFWIIVWLGTTLGGGVFGGVVGIVVMVSMVAHGSTEGIALPFIGLFVGTIWACLVGLLVVPTFAFLIWCFWLQKNPRILAVGAGALTGFFSAPFACLLTSPFGAVGAYLAVRWLLRRSVKLNPDSQSQQRVFSLRDLFYRMTGFAILLTIWMAVIRWFW